MMDKPYNLAMSLKWDEPFNISETIYFPPNTSPDDAINEASC